MRVHQLDCASFHRAKADYSSVNVSAQLSTDAVSGLRKVWVLMKLEASVYNILPSNTAVFSYAIGSRKLSANERFFVCLLLVLKQLYVCYKQLK